jgi:predicted RNA-binding Zn-ribbon protein involved in translation (DUF1610 family)
METPLVQNLLTCTQCGGELHADEGQIFLTCPFCGSSVYLDKSRVVFHWYIAPTLDEGEARASLARWMASDETVKDLDQKSSLTETIFEFFPMWYFKRRLADRREEILLAPAAATTVSEIMHMKLPPGDLRKYNDSLVSQAITPNVPLQTALEWAAARQVPRQEIEEQALVHVPLYTFKYIFQGVSYTALVEGASGGVFANIYPAKAEAPYHLAGWLTAIVFLCLALFPVFGGLAQGNNGFGIGVALCFGVSIIVVPALLALAAWVAAKV